MGRHLEGTSVPYPRYKTQDLVRVHFPTGKVRGYIPLVMYLLRSSMHLYASRSGTIGRHFTLTDGKGVEG
jgi:hypothetical protein